MTTMDDYVKQVVDRMPSGNPLRAQITLELKAMIGERLARGQSMDEVLRQLGDPASFARRSPRCFRSGGFSGNPRRCRTTPHSD